MNSALLHGCTVVLIGSTFGAVRDSVMARLLIEPSLLSSHRVNDALRDLFKDIHIDWIFGKRIVVDLGGVDGFWVAKEHR